jgi:hypothetical protein
MAERRLVGIDLGIASAHTVRVLDETGETVAKRKCWPRQAASVRSRPLRWLVQRRGPVWR